MSASVKRFGCRPLGSGASNSGGRRPKPFTRQDRHSNPRLASVLMNAARIGSKNDFCSWRMLPKPWSAAQAGPFLGPGDHFELRKVSEARLEIARFGIAP